MKLGETGASLTDINMTPLIDVMLVLLIIFIISLPPVTHAVKIDNPLPTQTPTPPKPRVVIRARAPLRLSSRQTRPSHNTNSPGRSSRRKAASGGAVVVGLLRGFGRKMLTRYAFGQKLLTCSAHHLR
jgi:hypothetical protein